MILLILIITCNVQYKLIYTETINDIFMNSIDSNDIRNPEYEPYYYYS